jgi:hypothetical protein
MGAVQLPPDGKSKAQALKAAGISTLRAAVCYLAKQIQQSPANALISPEHAPAAASLPLNAKDKCTKNGATPAGSTPSAEPVPPPTGVNLHAQVSKPPTPMDLNYSAMWQL